MEKIKFELHQIATGQILLAAYGRVPGGEGYLLNKKQVDNLTLNFNLNIKEIKGFDEKKYHQYYDI